MSKPIVALAFAAVICGGLTGCPGAGTTGSATDNQVTQKTLITACQGLATAENSIAGFIDAGQIKVESFSTIDKARASGEAFCNPDAPVPTDLNGATNQVLAATAALVALQPAGAK
jgi:hypothetical protein